MSGESAGSKDAAAAPASPAVSDLQLLQAIEEGRAKVCCCVCWVGVGSGNMRRVCRRKSGRGREGRELAASDHATPCHAPLWRNSASRSNTPALPDHLHGALTVANPLPPPPPPPPPQHTGRTQDVKHHVEVLNAKLDGPPLELLSSDDVPPPQLCVS